MDRKEREELKNALREVTVSFKRVNNYLERTIPLLIVIEEKVTKLEKEEK